MVNGMVLKGNKAVKVGFIVLSFFLALALILFGLGERLPSHSSAYASYGDYHSKLSLEKEYTFDSSKDYYTLTIPYNGIYKLECWGAQGGSIESGIGGKGGYVWADGYFTSGTTLYIYVGEAGKSNSGDSTHGGGGASDHCTSGGGSTDIRYNGTGLSHRIMVAGGGGGASKSQPVTVGSPGATVYANGGHGGGNYYQNYEEDLSQDNYGYGFDGGAGSYEETYGSGLSYSGELGARGGNGGTLTLGYSISASLSADEQNIGQSSTDGKAGKVNATETYYLFQGNYLGAGGGGYYGGYAGTADDSVVPSGGNISSSTYPGRTNYTYTVQVGENSSQTRYMNAACAAAGGGGSSYISGYSRNNNTVCAKNADNYEFLLSSNVAANARTLGGAYGGGTSLGNPDNGKAKITFLGARDYVEPTETIQRYPIEREGWYKIEAYATAAADESAYGDKVSGYVRLDKGTFLLMKVPKDTTYNSGNIIINAMPFNNQDRTQSQVNTDFNEASSTILCAGAGGNSSVSYLSGYPGQTIMQLYLFYDTKIEHNGNNASQHSPKVQVQYVSSVANDEVTSLIEDYIGLMGNSTAVYTVPQSGKYMLRAWGAADNEGKGGMACATVWLLENEKLSVDITDGTTKVYLLHGEETEDDNVNLIMRVRSGSENGTANIMSNDASSRLFDGHTYNRVNESINAFFVMHLVKIDDDVPTGLHITPNRDGIVYDGDGIPYYYGAVQFTFTANDIDSTTEEQDSGVVKYMYSVESNGVASAYEECVLEYDATTQTYRGTFTLEWNAETGIKTYTIYMYAVDFVGNGSSASGTHVTIGFDRTKHHVYYYDGSGDKVNEKTVVFNIESQDIDTETESAGGYEPVKPGLSFQGWYQYNLDNHTLTDNRYEAIYPSTYVHSGASISLYAKYTLNTVTITGEARTENATYNVGTGGTIAAPAHSHEAKDLTGFQFVYSWSVKADTLGQTMYNGTGVTTENYEYLWSSSPFSWQAGTYHFQETVGARIEIIYDTWRTKPLGQTKSTYTTSSAVYGPEITFVVAKKSLTHDDISVSGGNVSHEYTGLAITQNLTVSDKASAISSSNYTVEYFNNVNASTNVVKGTFTITATNDNPYYTGSVDDAEATTFTIEPKSVELTQDAQTVTISPQNENVVYIYNDDRHMPGRDDLYVRWERGVNDIVYLGMSDFDFSYGSNTDAGQGSVTVTGKGNYTGSQTWMFTIQKATPSIDVDNVKTIYTYNGETQTVNSGAFAYFVKNGVNTPTEQEIEYSGNTFLRVYEGDGKVVTIIANESANFNSVSTTVTLTVLRKQPTIDLSKIPNSFTYDGMQKTINKSATTDNFIPGSSTVREDAPSYILKDGETTVTTIDPETLTPVPTTSFVDVPLTYEEDNGVKLYYYDLIVSLPETSNYLEAEATRKIYVQKAEYVVVVAEDVTEYAVTYDGDSHTITGFASVPDNAQAGEITYSDNVVLNVPASGFQRVYAHVAETRNYVQTVEHYLDVPVYPVVPIINDAAITKSWTYNQGNVITVNAGATVYYEKIVNGAVTRVYVTTLVNISYENNEFYVRNDSGYMTVRVTSKTDEGNYNYAETTLDVYIEILKYTPRPDELELTAVYGQTLSLAQPAHPESVEKTADGFRVSEGVYMPDQSGDTGLGTVPSPITTLTATFIPDDTDNNNIVYNVPIVVELTKATRVLNVENVRTEYTYTGERQQFTGATIDDDEGTIEYSPSSFLTVADMNGEMLTITVRSTDNYFGTTDSLTITVNKAYEEIDLSDVVTYVYTGTTYSVMAGARLYNPEQENLLTYSENSFTTVAEAESTVVIIAAEGTDNYLPTSVEYTPVMARASVHFDHSAVEKNYTYQYTWEYDEERKVYVYTGIEQTVLGTVVCYNEAVRAGEEYVMLVEEGENMEVVFSNNTFTGVVEGNALEVTLSVAQTANYAATEATFTIHVEKAVPQTLPQTATATYGLSLMNATGLDPDYSFIDGSVSVGSVAEPATGLFVKYTPPLAYANDLLAVDTVPLTLTVVKGSSGLSVAHVETQYVYTGYEQTISSGATITNDEQTNFITYSNNTFTTVAEGNGMEVVITVAETDNYWGDEARVTIVVNKADPGLDVSDIPTEYVYTGERQTITGGSINNTDQTIEYSSNSFTTVAEGNALRSVRVSVEATDNYKQASKNVPITVLKATQEIDTTVAEAGYVYTGEEQTVTASIPDPEQTLVYTANTFTTVAEGNGLRISITAPESPNYNMVNKIITISVRKRVPETTAQSVTAYYGQILNEVKGNLNAGYSFEALLITSVGTPDNPTEVTVKYDSGNVNEEIVTGIACTLVVTPRPVTVRPNNVTTVYGEDGFTEGELSYTVTGNTVMDGDNLNVHLFAIDVLPVPGEYVIRATADNELYDVTSEEGVYTIEKRQVYITPDLARSYYGEEPSDLTYTITGGTMYAEDTLTGSLSIDVELLAGRYEIVNGVTHEYYDVHLTDAVYVVEKRPITVYADTATGIYGEEPDFTYVVEKTDGYGLTGEAMIGEDKLAGKLYLGGKGIGRQVILSGLYNSNYEIQYVSAYCMVSPAHVTVTAVRQTTAYGDRAVFSYEVTEGRLVEGDDVGAVLTQEEKNVGEYDIQGEFTNENYIVTFVSAKHVITPRPVTVKLVDSSRSRLTYLTNAEMDNTRYLVTQGTVVDGDDLQLVVVKEEGAAIGEYEMTATSENVNYDVTVRKGVFTITKDPSKITVDEKSLVTVYDGKEHQVKATVTGGAEPKFFYKGEQEKDVCVAIGQYLIRITADETDLYYAPEAVEVTLIINRAELKDESNNVTVLSSSSGFAPDEKLVVASGDVTWDEEEFGKLPDSYGVTESYVISKTNAKNEEMSLSGEITMKIKLSNRFAAGEKVSLALVCGDETVITEAVVGEDGTVTISGVDVSRVAVIEKQNAPSIAILYIVAGAAVLLLFMFIMIKAGLSRK